MKNNIIKTKYVFPYAVIILGLFLYFTNLGNIYLWQDEAQTALISQTVLQNGIPKGTDGKNFFSQELGAEYGEDYTYKWHTWLPFYILAATFKAFGSTTFTARLPFALFGLASLLLTYFLTRKLFDNERTAVMSTLVLLFSVPFMILSRQSRYYSMTAFFSLMTAYGYQRLVRGEKHGSLAYFAGATLLFHTHYIYVATLVTALSVHLLLFYHERWKPFLIATLAVLVFNGPWIIWLSSMNYGEQYGSTLFAWQPFAWRLTGFGKDIFQYLFSPYILVIPVVVAAYMRLRKRALPGPDKNLAAAICLPVLFIGSTVMALSLSAPAPFFRYLAPLIPFFAILAGSVFAYAMQLHKVAGVILVAGLIFFSPMKDYLYELTHDYNGPIEGIATFLNENADKDDVVAITYGDMPLKFYTDLRIVGGLTGEDLAPAKEADWIIIRKHVISDKDMNVRNYLISNIDPQGYQKIELDYPDAPFENRESPYEHLYRTASDYPRVTLYKKNK